MEMPCVKQSLQSHSSQVTFIYVVLYTIQIVSKMMHFGCCSAEVSSVLIQFCWKDH